MWIVRVKDRGRDLAVHHTERAEEAHELRRVYELLGYDGLKILVERAPEHDKEAA
jgi:hypothetical protein